MRTVQHVARRLSRQLREFDLTHFEEIFESRCARHGVPKSSLCVLPREWHISKSVPESSTLDIYASAFEARPTYYARAFMKDVPHIPLEVRLAHVFVHEMVHYVAGSRVESQMVAQKKARRKRSMIIHARLSGFQVDVVIEGEGASARTPPIMTEYYAFNEGVTELIAREVFVEWVRTIRLWGVEREAVEDYILVLDTIGFYQESVSFVRSLLMRMAVGVRMNPNELLGWLVQMYIEGSVLDQNARWLELLQSAQLPEYFSSRIAQAESCEALRALYQEYLAGRVNFRSGENDPEWCVDSFELILET